MIRNIGIVVAVLMSLNLCAQEPQLFAASDSELEVKVELYEFESPAHQKRAIALAKSLRCPQCQNQNLVESNSPLAKDLRLIVFEKINAGEDEQQVVDFMTARYGEFVRYKPSFSWQNSLLWGLPVLLLVGFFWLSVKSVRNRQP